MNLQWKGKHPKAILNVVKETPIELKGIYDILLDELDDPYETQTLLQWICFSPRPLQIRELREAMALQPEMVHKSVIEYQKGIDYATSDHQMELRVKDLSHGLAEAVTQGNQRVVQFIHQSVLDYMVKDGCMTWFPSFDDFSREGHFKLSRSCIRYLAMEDIQALSKGLSPSRHHASPAAIQAV